MKNVIRESSKTFKKKKGKYLKKNNKLGKQQEQKYQRLL
jgi:hypothetical protein